MKLVVLGDVKLTVFSPKKDPVRGHEQLISMDWEFSWVLFIRIWMIDSLLECNHNSCSVVVSGQVQKHIH